MAQHGPKAHRLASAWSIWPVLGEAPHAYALDRINEHPYSPSGLGQFFVFLSIFLMFSQNQKV
jgi:hypothetical protein